MSRITLLCSRNGRLFSLIMVFCLMTAFFPLQSSAYFNRGTVSVSLGKDSLSITEGSTSSVSVTVDPIKQDQLPGCGMAECPQTCGEGCLDANGECMCGGTEYKTYYSEIAVTSSDSSVAVASYSNGTLSVSGESPGNAVITVTGKLRQYTDASVALQVTVKEAPSSRETANQAASGSGDTPSAASNPVLQQDRTDTSYYDISGPGEEPSVVVEDAGTSDHRQISSSDTVAEASSGSSSTGIKEIQPYDSGAADSSVQETSETAESIESSGENPPEGEVRDTARGKYRFVVLTPSTNIPACFEISASEGSHLVFQKKNGDNILYSWSFDGNELESDHDYSDLNLDIEGSSKAPELLEDTFKGKDCYYMNFKYSGALPGAAEIYIKVTDSFSEDQDLYLYQMNEENGELTEISRQVKMSNGYATFTIDHCSSYLLTDSKAKAEKQKAGESAETSSGSDHGHGFLFALLMIVLFAASVILMVLYYKRRR